MLTYAGFRLKGGDMKRFLLAMAISVSVSNVWAAPPSRQLGVGVVIGDPFGPTLKYWFDQTHAFDVGAGFEDDFSIFADYDWQAWHGKIQNTPGDFGGYVGLGARFKDVDNGDNHFGLRTVAGIDYFFEKIPVEIYGELVPVFDVAPKADAEVDGGIGLRVYFGKF
jgi:hypothetical protein